MITTSLDGQWALVRRGREALLLASGCAPVVGRHELDSDDVELAFVGPPTVAVAIARAPEPKVVLLQVPGLEPMARLELERPMKLAAITGPRFALVADDAKSAVIVRAAGRGLSSQSVDLGSPLELAVGLERNQLLFSLLRKLEVWDAVSGRPLLRLSLQLPPPPRTVGAAQGHLWCTRPGSDEVHVYRLSDGRPFRHYVGATVEQVICHPASPVLVLVTPQGLVRLHCFAHSLTLIDAPWTPGTPLAQLAAGDDLRLLGLATGTLEPWSVAISSAGSPLATSAPPRASDDAMTTDKVRTLRERMQAQAHAASETPPTTASSAGAHAAPAVTPPAITLAGTPPAVAPPAVAPPAVTPPAITLAGTPPAVTPPAVTPPAVASHAVTPPAVTPAVTPPAVTPPAVTPPAITLAGTPPASAPSAASPAAPQRADATSATTRSPAWRDPLAAFGLDLARGAEVEAPVVGSDTELADLAQRLGLSPAARRALTVLYGVYLAGAPALPLARLARVLGDWTEPLGQGDLGALAMLSRHGGKVRLRAAVTHLLDGLAPRAIRVAGAGASAPRPGAVRLDRDGRSDAAIEAALVERLGRIAALDGDATTGVLEARLHGATALALTAPTARPSPWPRDAALIVVADAMAPAWVSSLPALG